MSNQITGQRFTRRSVMQLTGAVAAAGAIGASLSACGGPKSSISNTTATQTADVAIGYNNNSSWDPLNTGSAFAMAAHNHIYEPLWDADPVTRAPFAALATELPDATKTEWTVKLRSGAEWHDGVAVTADDVVYSVKRVLDTAKPILTNAFFATWLDSVTKVDDSTVTVKLKFAFPYAIQRFAVLKILPKHRFEGKEDDLKKGANALGSGPFKLTGHEDTSFSKFDAYAKYNGPRKPILSSMRWNVSVDAAARVGLLTSGAAGVQISDNIPQDNVANLKSKGLTVEGVDSMNLLGLAFNTSKPPFDKKRVRQALRMAIDAKKLIDIAIAGQGTPATCFLQEASKFYHKAPMQYAYDPERAKKILAEEGVTQLKVTLLSTNISWTRVAVNTIKENWDAIGVATTLDVQETAAFNTKVAEGAPVDVLTFSGNPNQFGADADLNVRWFYSTSNTFMKWNKWGATAEYKALETMLNQAIQAGDAKAVDAKMNDALDVIADEAVIYPVMHMKLFTAWDPAKLDGVVPLDIPGVNMLKVSRKA